MIRGQVPVTPSSANLRFSNRAVTNVPRTNESTRFFTHQQPGASQRIPFSQQSANRGAQTPSNSSGGGWRRFGEPGGQSAGAQGSARSESNVRGSTPNQVQNTRPQSSNGGGWQRFGEPGNAPHQGYNGSGNSSAPRYNTPAPRQSAPSYSAPRGGTSGGGGGSHPSGGGGGGSKGHR